MIIKKITITLLLSFVGLLAFSQTNADLVGEWYNDKEDVVITIFEVNQTISAKITWMQFPNDKNGNPKIDLLNPDESLRTNEILGMMIMSNFSHIAGNIWDNGTLYVPEKGKSFSGIMRLKDDNTLNVRGYVGFSFFERYSTTWTRVLDRYELVGKLNLLSQLKEDLMVIIKLIENISLKPAEEILQKIEKENLLIKLQLDLSKLIKKIETIKKAES